MVLKKFLRKASLSLCALVAACQATQLSQEKAPEGKNKLGVERTDARKRYAFSCVSFQEFNPAPNAQSIEPDPMVNAVLENGLDFLDNQRPDTGINDYSRAFENLVHDEARKSGYGDEELAYLSPKETALLTCKIPANRMNYFGILADYSTKKKRQRATQKMRSDLEAIAKNAATGEEDKKDTLEKLETLAKLEKTLELQERYEEKLSATNGSIRGRIEAINVESHLEGENGVICRQYAIAAKKMYHVFKRNNAGLRNTHVATYSYNNHLWNQISAVEEKNGVIYVTFSWFDATRYDIIGDPEGVKDHFDEHFSAVKLQVKKLINSLGEQEASEGNK